MIGEMGMENLTLRRKGRDGDEIESDFRIGICFYSTVTPARQ